MRGRVPGIQASVRALTALVVLVSCVPDADEAQQRIFEFAEAVQLEDLDRMSCLFAGAPGAAASEARAEFDAWARGRFAAYVSGRDTGAVDLGDDGIVLVKAFALAKGTFFAVDSRRAIGEGAVQVDTTIRFAYDQIDVSGFIPGTVFYVCGVPVGRIHAVRIPRGPDEITVEALDRVVVRWTLVATPAGSSCSEPWQVASVIPIPGTEATSRVTWRF